MYTQFADIILPLAIPQTLSYGIPDEMQPHIVPGSRVIVPVGNKSYTGIVAEIHRQNPTQYQVKPIEELLDQNPVIHPNQLLFWKKMAQYYMCTLGEVMKAALPAGLKLESETRYSLCVSDFSKLNISDESYLLLEAIQQSGSIDLKDAQQILQKKQVQKHLKQLVEEGLIEDYKEIEKRYKPKKIAYIHLAPEYEGEENLEKAFALIARAAKQTDVLMGFLSKVGFTGQGPKSVKKSELSKLSENASTAIQALLKKGIFEEELREESRLNFGENSSKGAVTLSPLQTQTYVEIKSAFEKAKPVLLHGITGSGKTEIYIRLIADALAEGKQVLYLLPEIALTLHLIERIKAYFPGQVAIYHSRFGQNERVEVWNNFLNNGDYKIVLGARSSLFLPFKNLGLIIVDEEHDSSYKQQDPAPRYHARDFSMVLAKEFGAQVIMGSATPSFESVYNCEKGKYVRVELKERYSQVALPEIVTVSLIEARKKEEMKSLFSENLLQEIQSCLDAKEQVILFQNRRGFSSRLECDDCGHVPYCENCDIALTYHKSRHELKCHLCGYMMPLPKECIACRSTKLTLKGFGTEKIEDELQILMPVARIARLDWDIATRKNAYHQVIQAFENREIDILVGTQMITKGLDFDHVGLVGVLNADALLHFPDFRANEKAFQLLTQVAGRAGRRNKVGKVILQTNNPAHPVIQYVLSHDYDGFYRNEIEERREWNYPPFSRIIRISLRHRDYGQVMELSRVLDLMLKATFKERVLGPETPWVGRIRNYHIRQFYLKIGQSENHQKAKELLGEISRQLAFETGIKSYKLDLDVDVY